MEANQLRDRALMLDESPEVEDNESNLGIFRQCESPRLVLTTFLSRAQAKNMLLL
jgi:hypothetical protein